MRAARTLVFAMLLLAPLGVLAVVALRGEDEAPADIRAATLAVVSEAQPRTIADEKRIAGVRPVRPPWPFTFVLDRQFSKD